MTARPDQTRNAWEPAIIVPAHNEGSRLPAMLRRLYADGELTTTRLIVVCNGCTDDSVDRARGTLAYLDHHAAVLDLPNPGKAAAIRTAEELLLPGPRLVLDADVGCDGRTATLLLAAVDSRADRTAESTARSDVAVPQRRIVTDAIRSPLVRAYYRVWRDFPWVRAMPSGRAAYALSWELREPQGPFPDVLNDDQWATSLVPRRSVEVVDGVVDVHPAPTLRELLAVRTRIYRGGRRTTAALTPRVRGSQRAAIITAARNPVNWVGLAVFLVIDRLAHHRARRSVATTWTKK